MIEFERIDCLMKEREEKENVLLDFIVHAYSRQYNPVPRTNNATKNKENTIQGKGRREEKKRKRQTNMIG